MAGEGLTAGEHLVATRATALTIELRYLDDFWTRQVGVLASGEPAGDLGRIVDRMDDLLQELGGLLSPLVELFESRDGDVRDGFAKLIGEETPEPRHAALLRAVEREGGDLAAAAAAAAKRLDERMGSVRRDLRAEFDRVVGGGASDGDLSQAEWKDIGLIAAGASVVLGPEAGAVVVAIAAFFELIL